MTLNRNIAPGIKDAVDFDIQLKPYQQFALDNGVEVFTFEGGSQDVMSLELVFYAGNAFEQKDWVAAATSFLLKNGTKNKTAFEVNEFFEYYGAYVNRHCYNETATITLHTLTKYFEKTLPGITELITDAAFPEKELSIYQQNQLQRLSLNLKKSDFVATRLIDAYLYGEKHPYGKYSTESVIKALEVDELKAFYQQYYTEGKCVIFAAGKFPENFASLLNQQIGSLPLNGTAINVPIHDIVPAAEKNYAIINDASSVQGSIRIASPFYNRKHPDFAGVQVLNTLFGGFFGSRLMSNIREDKGYTYGIHSYLQNHIDTSAWVISTDAGKDVCKATIDEVYKEMQILNDELVSAEELHLVKNYMLGSLLGDVDGPFQIIGRWKTYILNELTEAYFYNTIETVRTIQPEAIQALAKKYLQPEHFYELVVY